MMKKTTIILSLLVSMLCVPFTMQGKTYDRPIVGASNTRTVAIAKVITSDTATILHIDATFRPKNWILIATDTYLQVGDKKLTITGSEGIELGKEFWMPDSGKAFFTLSFPPLPKGTKRFDFIESDCADCFKIYDVELSGKKKYPAYPAGLPADVRKYTPKDGALPNAIFRQGNSQVNITLLGFHKGFANELMVYTSTYLQEQQEHTLKIDQLSGTASIQLDMFTSGSLTIGINNAYYIDHLWIAPGETTDIYVDLQQLTRRNVTASTARQTVYCTGTYRDLNMLFDKEKAHLPNYYFDYYSKGFVDYKVTADQYMSILKSKYDAVLDTIGQRPEISAMIREYIAVQLKHQLIFCTTASENILMINYRVIHDKWDRNEVIDYTFSKTDESHLEQLSQWIDVNNPNLLMNPSITRLLGGMYRLKNRITNPQIADILTARPLMDKAHTGGINDADKATLAKLNNSYFAPLCTAANEAALKEIAALKKSPLLLPTPEVENEKLFDALIAKHKGKVILVDFWNTWCSPCRSAIKTVEPFKTAELKSDKLVWIYIANETSPSATYGKMIKDIAGEHYRLNAEQWDYVCEQHKVDGIPFYVVVKADGTFESRPDLRDHHKLKNTLLELIK